MMGDVSQYGYIKLKAIHISNSVHTHCLTRIRYYIQGSVF